jgi:hypothetical protein
MASLDQPIPFLESIKDAIATFFKSKIQSRALQILVFSLLLILIWCGFLWLVHLAIPLILPTILITFWNFLFIPLLFTGAGWFIGIALLLIFQESKGIRDYLDFILFPLEFTINLLFNLFKKIKEWIYGAFNWLMNLIGILFFAILFFVFITSWIILSLIGLSVGLAFFIAVGIALAVGIAIILYALKKKEQVEETLCWFHHQIIEFKDLPSNWLNDLKEYIKAWMKTISDDQIWQVIVFLMFPFILVLSSLLILREFYLTPLVGDTLIIVFSVSFVASILYLALNSGAKEKAMENLLNFLLNSRLINLLVIIYENLLENIA